MKTSGIVFDMARLFTQPLVTDALIDRSRYHFNGTANAISAWEKLPSGLYCPKMVSASSSYYAVPDITPLLGAKQATWMAWVRKDAYVQYHILVSDSKSGALRWYLGYENAENRWRCLVGDNTNVQTVQSDGVFTLGWHFVWARFTASSVTGLEAGCDNTVVTPASTVAIAALGTGVQNNTTIGKNETVYTSMTLATLRICNVALTDGQIYQYREATRRLIGV
jgi:hypothetical protein